MVQPRKKATGRTAETERPSTSARCYLDTLMKLKVLADLDNLNLADELDKIMVAEFARRTDELHAMIDRLAAGE